MNSFALESLNSAERSELIQLVRELERRKKENRLAYYQPYAKQEEFHAQGHTRERLFMAGNQLGKELRFDEPVLTPSGWVPIGKLQVGDEVIAGDGSVTNVIGVFPQGVKPLIELTFDYGQKVVAGEEHLWKVLRPANRFTTRCESLQRENGKRQTRQVANETFGCWEVMTTAQMRAAYGDSPAPKYRFAIPAVGSAQLASKPTTVDPYLVGVLLGDGCLRQGCVSFSSADTAIIESVNNALPEEVTLVRRSRYDWDIVGTEKRDKSGRFLCGNPLKTALESLGMYGKLAHEKRVPDQYLWNSPDVRLAVLQGLMDTDGSCEKSGVTTFTSTSRGLADDVMFLVRSFGGKCKLRSRTTSYWHGGKKRVGRTAYHVVIRLPHVPLFRLERKLSRYIRPVSTTDHHLVVAFRDVEPAESFCISVDHPDKTYVTRDFIVTHNTWSGAYEMAMHLTGIYPDWWQGRRFDHPVIAWASGVTGESVRDTTQRLLMGRPGEYGTGTIPKRCLAADPKKAMGVPDLLDSVIVQHVSGGISRLYFKSYEKGREKWQGETLHIVWFDEEPPEDIYTEGLTRTNATGGMAYMTFTPLLGMSNVVRRFLTESSPDRVVVNMTIDDVEHYTPEQKARIIASYPAHEREARAKGTPTLGSGRIFPVAEEVIRVEPFAIPPHWPRICGLDFGWDHPTAAAWLAWDRDTDVLYVYDAYRVKEQTPVVHAAAIKPRGAWIPVAWPHDGLQHDKGSGDQLAQQYRDQGVAMLPERATFEDGSNGVEAGLSQLLERMQTGRLKVFSHLGDWFEEFRLYHRDKGRVVKEHDDLMAATRYGAMMLRFAVTPPAHKPESWKSRLLNQRKNAMTA